jgi:hypothetical protein
VPTSEKPADEARRSTTTLRCIHRAFPTIFPARLGFSAFVLVRYFGCEKLDIAHNKTISPQ